MNDLEQTVLSQYANSPTIIQLVTNMNNYLDPTANINEFYNDLWNINTAIGYGLDCWGRIVGVNRVLSVASGTYFGFTGPTGASGVPWNQGVFYNGSALTQNYSLTDNAYRTLILAKALANICNATIPAINQILINLFGPKGLLPVAGNSYCTDGENMTMTYTFGSVLTPLQQSIVYQSNVLPRPCGVAATVYINTGTGLENVGGVVNVVTATGWPTSATGLSAGALWDAGGVAFIVPTTTPSPTAPAVYFGAVTSVSLLALGGANMPLSDPRISGQLWNNGGLLCVSLGV